MMKPGRQDRGDAARRGLLKKGGPPSAALVRVLSKRGLSSRSAAFELVRSGKVTVNGAVVRDPAFSVPSAASIQVEGRDAAPSKMVYIVLNKPRGLVTTHADEKGRDTVFSCLDGATLPRVIAVGRLDKASEGLLLLTNDTAWAAAITDPATHVDKTYHVHIDQVADETLPARMRAGVLADGERLSVKAARILRAGGRNSWLEIVLDEGRNRHLRRMLDAMGVSVLRLLRVAIGGLQLGSLAKGQWRHLTPDEVRALRPGRAK